MSDLCPKILHLGYAVLHSITALRGWFSFEYFPPKTAEGVENLRKRIVKMKA